MDFAPLKPNKMSTATEKQNIQCKRLQHTISSGLDLAHSDTISNKRRKTSAACYEKTDKKSPRVAFTDQTEWIESPTKLLSHNDISAQWWRRDELVNIKASAMKLSAVLRKGGGSIDGNRRFCLALAHKKIRLLLNSDYQELRKLSPSRPDEDLQYWYGHNDGRRGLERYASIEYSYWNQKDTHNTRKLVFDEQRIQRELGSPDPSESIAKASRQATKRARMFALFMGEADALQVNAYPASNNDGEQKLDL